MSNFRIGDEVRVREDLEVGKNYNGIVFTDEMCINKCKKRTISKRWTTQSGIMHYHLDYDTKRIFTGDMLELVENSEEVKTAVFTKADLKDGMIVTVRGGGEGVIISGTIYCKRERGYTATETLLNYSTDLTFSCDNAISDIMQVSYMNKLLWKRKELYTLAEIYQMLAEKRIASTQRIKCEELFNKSILVTDAWSVINRESPTYIGNFKYTTERVWEMVEESE